MTLKIQEKLSVNRFEKSKLKQEGPRKKKQKRSLITTQNM